MMPYFVPIACVTLVAVALAGCSVSGELSRSDAAEAIAKRLNEVNPANKPLGMSNPQFDAGIDQGYWDNEGALTAKGRKLFHRVELNDVQPNLYIQASHQFKIVITGIRLDSGDAITSTVEFKLSNEGLTGVPRRFVVAEAFGTANFQHFDDGWRLESVSPVTSPVASDGSAGVLSLSSAEKQAEEREVVEQRSAGDLKKSQAREQLRIAATPTVTKVFECRTNRGSLPVYYRVTVTDVNIMIEEKSNVERTKTFDYKSVFDIRKSENYGNKYQVNLRWGGLGSSVYFDFFGGCAVSDIDGVVSYAGSNITAWHTRWDGVLESAIQNAGYDENGH